MTAPIAPVTTAWTRLIRFLPSPGAAALYGDALAGESDDIGQLAAAGKLRARVLHAPEGPFAASATVTDEEKTVHTLLGPLAERDCAGIKCIGLNYRKHILEAGRSLPPFPSLFIKPVTSLADYGEAVPIPKCAQDGEADYEGELCVVIGRDAKDVSKENAMAYVAGYVSGDDVSSRKWQRFPERAGGVPQWCFSKGFDKFAPIGPAIVAAKLISDPTTLELTTRVNGEVRQSTPIGDLVFDIPTLISFLSQGTTLRAGTVIMTGTPGGVGCAGPEAKWRPLKDGDEVEVEVSGGVGILRHTIKYE